MLRNARNLAVKYGPRLSLITAGVTLPMFAHAAIDVSAVTTGLTEAGVAVLAVLAGLLALSVSIFGLKKVYEFVRSKAGA